LILAQRYRMLAVLGIACLTFFLVIYYPLSSNFSNSDIQSLDILSDPLLLAVLFTLAAAGSLACLLINKNVGMQSIGALLFGFLFLGFWITKLPFGRSTDELYSMAHVNYLAQAYSVPFSQPNLGYFNFPGSFIGSVFLVHLAGLSVLQTRTLYSFVLIGLFPLLALHSYRRLFGTRKGANASVALVILGSSVLSRQNFFDPVFFGYIFLMLLFFLLAQPKQSTRTGVLTLVIFASLSITYFADSIFIILLYLLITFRREKIFYNVLCMILFFSAWLVFLSARLLGYLYSDLSVAISSPNFLFVPVSSLGRVESIPVWASIMQFIWLVPVYLVGGLIALYFFFGYRDHSTSLGSFEKFLGSGFVISVMFGVISIFGYPAGAESQRILMYSVFFTAPALALQIWKARRIVIRRSLLVLLCVALLTFPTFLVYNKSISTESVNYVETGAYEAISRFTPSTVTIWTSYDISWQLAYYLPDSQYHSQNQIELVANQTALKSELLSLTGGYLASNGGSTFIFSPRFINDYHEVADISPNDLIWSRLLGELKLTNTVYSNEYVIVFSNV
jgi:hypothetical protein